MDFFSILLIAVGLAMDAFAVSLAAGTTTHARGFRPLFRLSFHFGLFQFMMPVMGWYLGVHVASYILKVDHWVAFALLAFVGIRMIRSGLGGERESWQKDPSRGTTLVMLSVATSIDALAVGLSLAMLQIDIWFPSVMIGVVTSSLSLLGIALGRRLGDSFGRPMEIVGGIILLLIGFRILLTRLFFS